MWQFAVSFKVRHHCSPLVNELGIATEFNTVALSSNKTVFYTSSDERRAFVTEYWGVVISATYSLGRPTAT